MGYNELMIIILVLVASAIGTFLSSYLKEKGKTYATKTDIENLTDKVEAIRAQYAQQLEMQKQDNRLELSDRDLTHRLSLAAVDKRLAVHQEAYVMWWELSGNVHNEREIRDIVIKCQNWWVQNNLYLTPKVREAFRVAYMAADLHSTLLHVWRDSHDSEDSNSVKENWHQIINVGEIIAGEVKLPSFGKQEFEDISQGPSSS